MKTKKQIFLFPLITSLAFLIFTTGCSDDEPLQDAEMSMFTLLNSPGTITEHSVDKTGDLLIRFFGEVSKPANVKVHRRQTDTGNEDIVVDVDVDGRFRILKDIIYMEPGTYELYGEITIGSTTHRTDHELIVTVSDEKVDVGETLTVNLKDATQDENQLLLGRRYALELNWWLGPGNEPTNTRVEWKSDNEAVATVEVEPGAYNDGWLYIHDEGSFRITATSEEKPGLSSGKNFTGVENIEDDRPVITVNSTSTSPQIVNEVGNSPVDVRFTLESEQDNPDPADEHQWFTVNFAYDADGISQTVMYSVPKANIDKKDMPSGSNKDSYWLEAGNYTLRLWVPLTDGVSVPVRVWVSDAQVASPN